MKRLLSLLAVPLLAIGLAACGDDDDDPTLGADDAAESSSTTAEEEGDDEDASTPEAAPPDGDAVVLAAGETSAGTHLTVEGMTVYLFTQDPAGGDSACTGGCLDAWPPLTADGDAVAGDGVDESLVGTAPLPDGSQQVTYDGHRLYYYASDAAPGDVTGQGVGDVWFVVSPEGEPISS